MQRINIEQVQADSTGQVVSKSTGLAVESPVEDIVELEGKFDSSQGVLTLSLPTLGTLRVSGFPSAADLGHGPQGDRGPDGRDGIDGLMGRDGRRGADGCDGPRGAGGAPGRRGPRGLEGPVGPVGPTGATGPRGEDGTVQMFQQAEDPVIEHGDHVLPGCIWVRT